VRCEVSPPLELLTIASTITSSPMVSTRLSTRARSTLMVSRRSVSPVGSGASGSAPGSGS
jgi:hypothetical protein